MSEAVGAEKGERTAGRQGYRSGVLRPDADHAGRQARIATGVVFQQFELTAKRLDLLTQAVPRISRIVLLYDIAGVDQAEAAKGAALGIPLEPTSCGAFPMITSMPWQRVTAPAATR